MQTADVQEFADFVLMVGDGRHTVNKELGTD